jgi:hypothetical protein
MDECIFIKKPGECQYCLKTRYLQCLLNKQHLKVSVDGVTKKCRLTE